MIRALPSTSLPPSKLRPVTKQIPINHWHEDLDYLENEVLFYQKLLKMGVHNCPDGSRAAILGLLDGFSNYLDPTIADLRSELRSVDLEAITPSFVFSFQRKLERHFLELRKLKQNVFPHVNHIHRISLW